MDGPWWDRAASGSPDANVFQSTGWARYLAASGAVRHVWAEDEDGRPAGLLVVQKIAGTPRGALRRILAARGSAYTWRHGPLVLGGAPAPTLAALLGEVDAAARREGVGAVERVTPPLTAPADAYERAYAERGYAGQRAATILVELQQPRDLLWRGLHPSARKAVARCRRQGVTIRRLAPDEPLDRYLEVLRETRARLGLPMPPTYPCDSIREAFRDTAARCEVFVAEQDGRMLGGLGVLAFGTVVHEIAVAQSGDALERHLYTGDAIKWAVIEWARQAGFRSYDLGGIDLAPADPKAAGIRRFKEKWGGRTVEYPRYDRERRGVAATVFRRLRRLREVVW